MTSPALSSATLSVALLLATVLSPTSPARAGGEVGAAHLVFERPTKMKKAGLTLYLSFADQTLKRDTAVRERQVECRAIASGRKGPLPATGEIELALTGRGPGGAPWRSSRRSAPLDGDGEARFDASEILELVDEATATGAEIELIRIDHSGGKGKKISTLTVDCLRRPTDA